MYTMRKSRKTKRNKILLSVGLIAISAIYVFSQYGVLSQYVGNIPTTVAYTTPSSQQTKSTSGVSSSQTAQSAPPPKSTAASGLYADGTYTGSSADAYYGTVQVQAVIQSGKLVAVNFLQYPSDRSTSRSINAYAMSILKSEAIQAQNANVNIVSGATDTSQAFQQSLHSALSQALG